MSLPAAQYPDVVPPTIVVRASYPGASPEVIAETVATPIEQEVNGVEDMLYMSSQSTTDGQMTLTITFKLGTDLDTAQVLVQNRVAIAEPRLPEDVRRLGVTTLKSSPDLLDGDSPDFAGQAIRPALHRQLRADSGPRRPGPRRRRGRRDALRPPRVQHAGLARPGAAGPLSLTPGDVVRAARAEPASRLRRHRPAARSQPGPSISSRSTRSAGCWSRSSSATSSSRRATTAA